MQLGGYDGGGNVSTIRFAQSDVLPLGAWSNKSHRVHGGPQALAPSYDLGSPPPSDPPGSHAHWIHARNKSEVGRRLGLLVQPLLDASRRRGSSNSGGGGGDTEMSGPVVQSVVLRVDAVTHLPSAVLTLTHAAGLALLPAQGCFAFCCAGQHNKSIGLENLVFQVANRHGVWLPAAGVVAPDEATLIVTPFSPVTCPQAQGGCWLASVRYAVVDVPECALYNEAMLPALPFELPVPWIAPVAPYE